MPASLLITTEEGVTLQVRLGNDPVSIGRGEDSTVRAGDRTVSRRHVEFHRLPDGDYEVRDCGSSYGTTLNGQVVSQERLHHLDLIGVGGLKVQFHCDPDPPGRSSSSASASASASSASSASTPPALQQETDELRAHLQALIDENAAVRRDLGQVREDKAKVERRYEEAHDEAARLREVVADLKKDHDELTERLETLGKELRDERGSASARAQDAGQRAEAASEARAPVDVQQAERQRARVAELEKQQAQSFAREQALKKEVERLTELSGKRDQREAELTKALKPALMRIAQLQDEQEKLRIKLATALADLDDCKRQR